MDAQLSKYLSLPSGEAFDEVIENIDHKARHIEGGICALLGIYRVERKSEAGYNLHILRPLADTALQLEDTDFDGHRIDQQHQLANAAFSGMIFGDILKSVTYVGASRVLYPYYTIVPNINLLKPGEVVRYAELGLNGTGQGRRFAHYKMADLHTNVLALSSQQTINAWASRLIPKQEHQNDFRRGLGIALYAAYDLYTDILDAQQIPYNAIGIRQYEGNDRGDHTSI